MGIMADDWSLWARREATSISQLLAEGMDYVQLGCDLFPTRLYTPSSRLLDCDMIDLVAQRLEIPRDWKIFAADWPSYDRRVPPVVRRRLPRCLVFTLLPSSGEWSVVGFDQAANRMSFFGPSSGGADFDEIRRRMFFWLGCQGEAGRISCEYRDTEFSEKPCPLLRNNRNSARQCLELITRLIEHESFDLPPDQPGQGSRQMAVISPRLLETYETERESEECMEDDPSDDEDYQDDEDEDDEDYED